MVIKLAGTNSVTVNKAEKTSVGIQVANTFKANFTPTDTANYNSKSNVDVTGLTQALALSLCTPAEYAAYMSGAKIELTLEIRKAGALMTGDVVSRVTNAVQTKKHKGVTGAQYFDISLYKKVGNAPATKVTDLNGQMVTIVIDIPEDMIDKAWDINQIFYLVRDHGGAATVLVESTDDTISFASDLYSIYAICYNEVNTSAVSAAAAGTASSNNTVAGNTGAGVSVVAPKTSGEDAARRMLVLFGTASALAAIAARVYVFKRREEEE